MAQNQIKHSEIVQESNTKRTDTAGFNGVSFSASLRRFSTLTALAGIVLSTGSCKFEEVALGETRDKEKGNVTKEISKPKAQGETVTVSNSTPIEKDSVVTEKKVEALRRRISDSRLLPFEKHGPTIISLADEITQMPNSEDRIVCALALSFNCTVVNYTSSVNQAVIDLLQDCISVGKPGDFDSLVYRQIGLLDHYNPGLNVKRSASGYTTEMKRILEDQTKVLNADLILTDINGHEWNIRKLLASGKSIWINAWAISCSPCVEELPDLRKIYNQHKSEGLIVFGVTWDSKQKLEPFVKKHSLNYPVISDTKMKVMKSLGMQEVPQSVLYIPGKAPVQAFGNMSAVQMENFYQTNREPSHTSRSARK